MKLERNKFLIPEQCCQLISYVHEFGPRRDYMLFLLGMNLATRGGEVVRLRPRDFSPTAGMVSVPTLKRLSPSEKKAKRQAKSAGLPWRKKPLSRGELPLCYIEVPLAQQVFREVEEYIRTLGGSDWLFPGRGGKHLSMRQAERLFRAWADEVGLSSQVSLHALRHSRGVDLRVKKLDILEIQRVLRHESTSSTWFYQHLLPDEEKNLGAKTGSLGLQSTSPDVAFQRKATSGE